jgi:hypothetical protein
MAGTRLGHTEELRRYLAPGCADPVRHVAHWNTDLLCRLWLGVGGHLRNVLCVRGPKVFECAGSVDLRGSAYLDWNDDGAVSTEQHTKPVGGQQAGEGELWAVGFSFIERRRFTAVGDCDLSISRDCQLRLLFVPSGARRPSLMSRCT